jgi:hypothetical protein
MRGRERGRDGERSPGLVGEAKEGGTNLLKYFRR